MSIFIDQVFLIFTFFFQIIYSVKYCIWPFLHKKNHYFRKEFRDDTFFLLCSYFRAHPTTLLLKILGGRMHGPSPPQILGDRPPPVPLGLRPGGNTRFGVAAWAPASQNIVSPCEMVYPA